jgi:hypothetical protein
MGIAGATGTRVEKPPLCQLLTVTVQKVLNRAGAGLVCADVDKYLHKSLYSILKAWTMPVAYCRTRGLALL